MDNRYLENVINELKPFLDENGFKETENGYKNSAKAINICYDDNRQMYILNVADIDEESGIGEYKELSSWLFDDTQNAKDAVAVGIDFTNSLRKELGIKYKRPANVDGIELPTSAKAGNSSITGFTKKMLDIFPPLKAVYKNHIAIYGNFLYLNFYGEHLVPGFKKVFLTGTSKQIKKFTDVLRDAYTKGDRDTVNVVVALLCAAAYKEPQVADAIKNALAEDTHLLTSFENLMPIFEKNKKLKAALIK